jgi:putative transposase
MKIIFTKDEYSEINKAVEKPPERAIQRKIIAVKMVMESVTADEIRKYTGYNANYVYDIAAKYQAGGIKALCDKRGGGNHRRYSKEKERELFEEVKTEAEKGIFPRISEIRSKIEEKVGEKIPRSTFYEMVHRQKGRKVKPRGQNPGKADQKKLKMRKKLSIEVAYRNICLAAPLFGLKPVLLFEDEAGFGRISEPSYFWVFGVPCVRVRQFRYVFGAVEPQTGDFFYDFYEKANAESYNDYLAKLSHKYSDSLMLLIGDGASYHKSKDLVVPENIRFFQLPAKTPEMNPAEQCWREIRTAGFKNILFDSIKDFLNHFRHTVSHIPKSVFHSITQREWLPFRC